TPTNPFGTVAEAVAARAELPDRCAGATLAAGDGRARPSAPCESPGAHRTPAAAMQSASDHLDIAASLCRVAPAERSSTLEQCPDCSVGHRRRPAPREARRAR